MTGEMERKLVLLFLLWGLFYFGCGGYKEENPRELWRDTIAKNNLQVWSVFGHRKMNEDATVDFEGWFSDKPHTIFAVDESGRTYFMAYVIPESLAREVGAQNLEYFYQRERVNIDERTTALSLVIMAPPYFWMFTPRAIVFVADKIVKHPDFELLVSKIRESNLMYPGNLTQNQEVYALAAKIAEDVRSSLNIHGLGDFFAPRIEEKGGSCISEEEFYERKGVPKLEDADGMKVKFVSKHMVYYGGGFYSSEKPWDQNQLDLAKTFVVNAQDGKIDLSLDNILSFNIFNPKVETEVEAPPGLHTVKIYKGFELSTSIFTEPVKRIGLIANLGRIVKFIFELVVPNIAACIPDGYTWGWFAAHATNLYISSEYQESILGIIYKSGAWDEIVRLISGNLPGWVQWLLGKVGLRGCGSGVNFVINQLAATLSNFPIVKIWNALTKYIPFGWELFTLPKGGAWLVAGGQPIYSIIVIKDINPKTLKSGQKINMELFGAQCVNCGFEISCPNGSDHIGLGPLFCGETYSLNWPLELWGDCRIKLIQQQGSAYTVAQSVRVQVEKCPDGQDCSGWVDPMEGQPVGVTEEAGCQIFGITSVMIYALGILSLFVLRRRRNDSQ